MVPVAMHNETRITVPTGEIGWISRALADAGLTVLDTGDRVTTETGVDAEAVLAVASFEEAEDEQASMQGSRLRP